MSKRRHHDMDVWHDGLLLVRQVYTLSAQFPDAERFGLVSQLRRAAVSIPSNIAEGCARGSLAEVETQVIIARDLGYCGACSDFDELLERLFARLNNLLRALKD